MIFHSTNDIYSSSVNLINRFLCFIEGGSHHHQNEYDHHHLICNLFLRAMEPATKVLFVNKSRLGRATNETQSLDFQTIKGDAAFSESFKNLYNTSNYSNINYRWLRSAVAVIPIACHLIQSIFLSVVAFLYEISYRLNLSKDGSKSLRLFFRVKCDLYISWGHLQSVWNTEAGLQKIHRGKLEQWKNGCSLCTKEKLLEIISKNYPIMEEIEEEEIEEEEIEEDNLEQESSDTGAGFFSNKLILAFNNNRDNLNKKELFLFYENVENTKKWHFSNFDKMPLIEIVLRHLELMKNPLYCSRKLNYQRFLSTVILQHLDKFNIKDDNDLWMFDHHKLGIFFFIKCICSIEDESLQQIFWHCFLITLNLFAINDPENFENFCKVSLDHFLLLTNEVAVFHGKTILINDTILKNYVNLCFSAKNEAKTQQFSNLSIHPYLSQKVFSNCEEVKKKNKINFSIIDGLFIDILIKKPELLKNFFLHTLSQKIDQTIKMKNWLICIKNLEKQKSFKISKYIQIQIFFDAFFQEFNFQLSYNTLFNLTSLFITKNEKN